MLVNGHICASIVGDVTSMATIPSDMEVEAHFLAKEDGIVAGVALAEMVFHEVDPSLKVSRLCISVLGLLMILSPLVIVIYSFMFHEQVDWSQKDGDPVQKGLKIGKVHGKLEKKNSF